MRHHYFARRNELFLDIDDPELFALPTAQRMGHVRIFPSLTRGHFHVVVTLHADTWPGWKDEWRIPSLPEMFEQEWTLGSDARRANANLARYRAGATKPDLLIAHGRKWPDFRAPDFSCGCQTTYKNGERLASCLCLIEYAPFKWAYGTLTNNPTAEQRYS